MHDWIAELNVWLYGLVSALLGGVVWVVRKISTNEKQLALLKAEIALREEYRTKQDEEIKSQLLEIRTDIKSVLNK